MADATIANLTDGTTAVSTDRIPVERSPFGVGTNRYITPAYISTLMGVGGLTMGRVPYASGPGVLGDSSSLTYSASTGFFVGADAAVPAVAATGVYTNANRIAFYNTGMGANDRIVESAWGSSHYRIRFMPDDFSGAVNAVDIVGGYSAGLTSITLGSKFTYTEATGNVTIDGLVVTKGYTVATLPAGVLGAVCHVTDQLTTAAAKGVAPTGGGSVKCMVFYNGSAWVGI